MRLYSSTKLDKKQSTNYCAPPGRAEDGAPDLGLSKAHISPQGKVQFWTGGGLLRINKPAVKVKVHQGGGKRGEIKEFSKASRRRLMIMVRKTRKEDLPVFVTLTYPGEYPEDPRKWKRDLDNWLKRLKRKFPSVGGVWKLEPQKRGAPHYHLLIWGPSYVELLQFVPRSWYEVVNSGDDRHLRAGTQVAYVRSWAGVVSYAGKYLGKLVDSVGWKSPGRFWGVFGDTFIPWAALMEVPVFYNQAVQLFRYARRYARMKARNNPSMYLFCDPDIWLDRLDRLLEN